MTRIEGVQGGGPPGALRKNVIDWMLRRRKRGTLSFRKVRMQLKRRDNKSLGLRRIRRRQKKGWQQQSVGG
jgi:hypothetical protein